MYIPPQGLKKDWSQLKGRLRLYPPQGLKAAAVAIIAWRMFHHDLKHTGVGDKCDVIYVGSDDNKVYALNPDGTLKWSYTTGSAVYSSPAMR